MTSSSPLTEHQQATSREPANLLIFRIGSIGDTVVTLPCLHAIARKFPQHRRVLLTNTIVGARESSAEAILAGTGLIDRTLYFPVGSHQLRHSTTLLRELRGLRSRALVYLTPRTTALQVYRDLTFFLAAGVRKFIGVPLTAALRQCRVDAGTGELEYECERLARTLHPAIPVDLSAPNWDFRLSAAERALADKSLNGLARWRPMLAVAPGAKIAAKNWGERRWVELLKSLQQRTPIVALVFVGALDDWPLCERLSQLWPGPSVNLCGELTPRESAAVLGRCALLVCQDSGPMHLAASQGTPCVALFGTYNKPRQWFPFGSDHEVIYDPEGIEHIRVVTVINAVMAAVGRRDKGRGLWQPSLPLSPGRIADDRARHL